MSSRFQRASKETLQPPIYCGVPLFKPSFPKHQPTFRRGKKKPRRSDERRGLQPCMFQKKLALRELRTLTSLLQAVLLALNHTGVAREVASLLQVCTVVASLEKSASDAVAQSAGLAGNAAAIAASDYVEVTLSVGNNERGGCVVEKSLTGRNGRTGRCRPIPQGPGSLAGWSAF